MALRPNNPSSDSAEVQPGPGAVVGAEGMICWHHRQFGVLTPDKFLNLAMLSEQTSDFAVLTMNRRPGSAGLFQRASFTPLFPSLPYLQGLLASDWSDRSDLLQPRVDGFT